MGKQHRPNDQDDESNAAGVSRIVLLLSGMFIGGLFSMLARRVSVHIARVNAELMETNAALRDEIGQREKIEQALERSEMQFRSTFDHAGIGMTVVDMKGNVLAANPAFAEFSGYDQDELIGMNVERYAYPEDLAHGNELLFEMIEGKRDSYQVEKRYVTKNGTVVWGRLTASIARNPAPEPPFIIGMIEDITERKEREQIERAIEQEKMEFYRRTITAATDGKLIIMDRAELEELAREPEARWEVRQFSDVFETRNQMLQMAEAAGIDEERAWDLVTCVGEAASNAIKHARGGNVCLHRRSDELLFVISDSGPGIPALTLPEVTIRGGFSTAGTLGMGYKLMISLGDKVYLATGPTGTVTGIQMKLKPAEPSLENISLASFSEV